MMLDLRNIHSLTDFLRNHKEHVARLRDTAAPEVLTVNGKPELVLQSAESYQAILDRLEYAEGVAGLRRAYQQIQAGQGLDLEQSLAGLRKKHAL
jgi:PHD/YefM family antitoxin component YafN of YafNO toxin-antitoxin module